MKKAYYNPTARILYPGALRCIAEKLAQTQARSILLVLGKQSFKRSAHYAELQSALKGMSVHEIGDIQENPSVQTVEELEAKCRTTRFEAVVAVGGGSVMDVAKLLAVLLAQENAGTLARQIQSRDGFARPALPMFAVPTTAGTGSEVTPYASLETAQKGKITVTHDFLFPKLAILDPDLTFTMPPAVTASTGFDAFSQAIESYWSVHASPFSDSHALRAAALIRDHLVRAVRSPADAEARYAMLWAASESGLAISHTATTAVHAVSYPLTTHFKISHGHACALTLAEFLRFNRPVMTPERYGPLWQALRVKGADEAANLIERMMEEAGLERKLSRLGLRRQDLGTVLQNGFRPDRVKNNPRELTPAELETMLERIY